jgi:hypothetical protein
MKDNNEDSVIVKAKINDIVVFAHESFINQPIPNNDYKQLLKGDILDDTINW